MRPTTLKCGESLARSTRKIFLNLEKDLQKINDNRANLLMKLNVILNYMHNYVQYVSTA